MAGAEVTDAVATLESKGIAPIKQEFRKVKSEGQADSDPLTGEKRPHDALVSNGEGEFPTTEDALENAVHGDGSSAKKAKFDKSARQAGRRGQNKKKERHQAPVQDDFKLCNALAQGNECPYGDKCKFTHDVTAYLAAKEPDLEGPCPQIKAFGSCKFGPKCRFYGTHARMIDDADIVKIQNPNDIIKNGVTRELQKSLRSNNASLPRTEEYLAWLQTAKAVRAARIASKIKEAPQDPTVEDANELSVKSETPIPQAEEQLVAETSACNEQQALNDASTEEASVIPGTAQPVGTSADKPEPELSAAEKESLKKFDYDPATIRFRCDSKKRVDFRHKTYLAPLTTVGNLPFRRICKQFGVDITCGEMAMTTALLSGQGHEWALTRRHVSEDIFGLQIAGSQPRTVLKVCEAIAENNMDVDFVDLNLGCPVEAITKMGCGSALLEQRGKLYDICAGANYALGSIPLTVKIRQGIYTGKPVAHKLLPLFKQAGVSMVTLHGRSKEQRYTKLSDWSYIQEMSKLSGDDMLFFGNGDILSHQEYWNYIEKANVDGCMIGRGALIKPWIFTEIKERRVWDISSRERLDFLKDFVNNGLEYWGSDTQGVNTTRRFLCEWLSFLHRYIPVGLLEVLPQRINDRPPPYVGRDDLETLMASPNSNDWVKISEMLLGPAPSSFKFIPKHKSNAYEVEG
ncbi:tRNA-dihydrouridine(47) synthase [NAD(P)(+)]-like protein [Gaertneriomyces sp. JEL0708]|nr:tRNA-dihydrouridine(47) synthase [NAD(P)(+)]-like protein [Gaertneriomyces sp. JEL0708]